jgi:hypothetical protein
MQWDGIAAKLYFALGVVALLAIPVGLAWAGLWLVGLLFALPMVAWLVSRLLVQRGGEALGWISSLPLRKWQGSYYAFNEVQVRVYEDEDDLWFVAADVLTAVGMRGVPDSFLAVYPDGSRVIPGTRLTGLNAAAVEQMLGKRNEHEAIRFLLWMRREVVKPWERKRERA